MTRKRESSVAHEQQVGASMLDEASWKNFKELCYGS